MDIPLLLHLDYSNDRVGPGLASRRLLDTQLRQLVDHGILTKTIFDERPPKVEYALTPLGKTLIPIIASTARWGELYREELEPLLKS